MKGYFDESGKPKVDITVVGLDEQTKITASIDTGFDGALMMSLPKALSIGLKLVQEPPMAAGLCLLRFVRCSGHGGKPTYRNSCCSEKG